MDHYGSGDEGRSHYDEIRERLVERGARRGYPKVPKLGEGFRRLTRISEYAAVLLDKPLMLGLAGCLALTPLLAFGLYPFSGRDSLPLPLVADSAHVEMGGGKTLPERVAVSSEFGSEPLLAAAETDGDTPSEVPPIPLETVAQVSSRAPVEPMEVFVVQVGTFRSPLNAERVASSLEQSSDAPISVLAGEFHTVRVGPFPQKTAALNAAQSIEEAIGLRPLVIRLDGR